MRCWGSIRDTEFLQERLEDIVDDGGDDDTSDLHPWKKNEIRDEEMEEGDDGGDGENGTTAAVDDDDRDEELVAKTYEKAPSEAKSKKDLRMLKRTKTPNQKSIPVRRKIQKFSKMEE